MGLFSFIKDAGAKLFGGKTSEEKASEHAKELAEQKADKLRNAIEAMGFKVTDLDIEVDGDTVTVYGEAENQETKEKVVLLVGNTEGVANVDDRMDVAIEEAIAQFYTVVKGDTLGKIAKEFYGNAMKYPVIFEANKPMLKSPDLIYPGQVLRIPALEA